MPWDGSGNYSPPAAPTFPAVAGTTISSTYYNSVINDLSTAIGNCLTKDNQNKPSVNYDFNAKNLTNVAVFAATGNATIGGTLGVTGVLTAASNITVGGTLDVTGLVTAPAGVKAVAFYATNAGTDRLIISADAGTAYMYSAGYLFNNLAGTVTYAQLTAGGMLISGNTVWHAGNDGAGSGLDADTVDGIQAAAFALLAGATFTGGVNGTQFIATSAEGFRLASANPYMTFYNAAQTVRWGYINHDGANLVINDDIGTVKIGVNKVWHAGNDGAGSGLDADLLDGVQLTAIAQLSGASFTGEVSSTANFTVGTSGSFIGASSAADNFTVSSVTIPQYGLHYGARPASDVAAHLSGFGGIYLYTGGAERIAVTAGGMTINGNTAWHAGNDGSGSGLDADLLDGVNGLDYRRLPRSTTATTASTADVGKCVALSAGMTIPDATFSAGDALSFYNDTAGNLTLTAGGALTLRLSGTTTTGNRTLLARGVATVWFNGASEAIISGAVS